VSCPQRKGTPPATGNINLSGRTAAQAKCPAATLEMVAPEPSDPSQDQ
jgi:hypothetical protein